MAREYPILFSGPMVRAILEGRKTQTRRVIQLPRCKGREFRWEGAWKDGPSPFNDGEYLHIPFRLVADGPDGWEHGMTEREFCPYGVPGDRLWVREAFALEPKSYAGDIVHYRADLEQNSWSWRPSIHMPRWACRLRLEVTSVCVERLQDISEVDAKAEGITKERLEDLLKHTAARCKTTEEYWINGSDESLSYCEPCALKRIQELKKEHPSEADEFCLDGGWGIEGDSTPFCETCGARLENHLTDYGAEQEFEHFLEHGCDLRSPDDCYSLLQAADSQMWTVGERFASDRDCQHQERIKRAELFHRVAWRVAWDSINADRATGAYAWKANPWVWVVEFKKL